MGHDFINSSWSKTSGCIGVRHLHVIEKTFAHWQPVSSIRGSLNKVLHYESGAVELISLLTEPLHPGLRCLNFSEASRLAFKEIFRHRSSLSSSPLTSYDRSLCLHHWLQSLIGNRLCGMESTLRSVRLRTIQFSHCLRLEPLSPSLVADKSTSLARGVSFACLLLVGRRPSRQFSSVGTS